MTTGVWCARDAVQQRMCFWGGVGTEKNDGGGGGELKRNVVVEEELDFGGVRVSQFRYRNAKKRGMELHT